MFNPEETMVYYSANNMKRLKDICDKICKTSGWVNGSIIYEGKKVQGVRDKCEDMYEIANEVLFESCMRYDTNSNVPFEAYLINNLKNRHNSYIRKSNTQKRIPSEMFDYIDAPTTEKHPLSETLSDGKTVESIVFPEEKHDGRVDEFKLKLSKKQNQILDLLVDNYKKPDIMKILKMSSKEYDAHLNRIKRMSTMLI